jgi:hypothetical protein
MIPPDQQAALTKFLNEKWKNSACPQCTVNNWQVNGWLTMIVSDRIGIVLGGPVIPIIALSCGNCGNTIMVNALTAGVMPPDAGLAAQAAAASQTGPAGSGGPTGGSRG